MLLYLSSMIGLRLPHLTQWIHPTEWFTAIFS